MSPQTTFTANSEAQLNADLALINSGGADAATATAYTITLTGSFTLNTALTAVNLLNSSSLTVVGGAFAISGANTYAGFDIAAGSVDLSNLTLQNMVAQGGAGGTGAGTATLDLLQGGGGGGGAGLGGAIYVASGASATLDSVTFSGDSAIGGAGGIPSTTLLANGTAGGGTNGGAASGLVGGLLVSSGGGGLEGGGGGGSTGVSELANGGAGSFGGGGGGGGGISVNDVLGAGGAGGFGGGGGAGGGGNLGTGIGLLYGASGAGGFGGGTANGTAGGGGLGAGADVFVQTGGTLTVDSGTLGAGTVTGGAGGTAAAGSGSAFGSGIFEQSGTIALAPASGQTATISGTIADPSGSVSGSSGTASLKMTGAGTVVLGAANTFSGGDVIQSGTVELATSTSAGSGTVTFAGTPATLKLDTNTLPNTVAGLVSGDKIDFSVLPYVAGGTTATLSGNATTLTITNGTITNHVTISGVTAGTSFHAGSDGHGGTLVQIGPNTPPTITAIASTPSSGDLDAGNTVTLTLTPSIAVTVSGGTPSLTLNDGGTATYNAAASTPTSLVFTTTVAAGQNAATLGVTGVSLNGATISDSVGNLFSASSALPAYIGPKIDTTPPTVTAITSSPASGDFDAGQTIALTLATSETVTTTGAPTLTLNDGATATYNAAASTGTSLVFDTVVASGQNVTALGITSLNLNGGSIDDGAGNAITTTLPSYSGPKIDTTPPTITGVAANPASGTLNAGNTITLTLTPSESIVVAGGTPTLILSDGGTATYNSAASTPTSLVFSTVVAAGQSAGSLTITALHENGATIDDLAGNALNAATALPSFSGPSINTSTPDISAIASTPTTGDLDAGHTVTLTLTPSESVTVSGGTPSLTLNDGGAATYNASASTPTALVFSTTVAAGQNAASLGITALNLNGATIADSGNNALSATAALPSYSGPKIDTTPPTITAVTASPASGSVNVGATVTLTLTPSEAMSVTGGTPTLLLNDSGTATYNASASTPTALVFTTTIAAGQNASNLAINSLQVNGATLADLAGNNLNSATTLPSFAGPSVSTTTPAITAIASTPATGDLDAGSAISFSLATSEAVTVAGGTPSLTLNDGGTATFNAAASTPTSLVFTTTVAAGQNVAALGITGLTLNGATIADSGGNSINLANPLPAYSGPQIDTTAPSLTTLTSAPSSGDLDAGNSVTLTLGTSEAVTVTGTPTLTLTDGGTATYTAASSTPTALAFTTTVAAGQNAASLGVQSLNLTGSSITDGAGNAISTVLPSYSGPQVDTTAPTLTAIASNPSSGQVTTGQVITFSVTPSEAVTVSGGTPSLTLNDGGSAVYNPSASTPTMLVFTTTVANGQNAGQLAISALALNGSSIADGAGNPLNAGTLPGYAGPGVSTTQDTITAVAVSPATGDFDAGNILTLILTPSAALTVAGGTPTLSLNDGGTATYSASASSGTALVFTTTVAAGQNAASLGISSISLNGATITDGSGHSLDLTTLPSLAGPQIDTTPPTITAITSTSTPASGTPSGATSLPAGSTVTLTLAMSESTVVTGSPTLALNDGGSASYVASSSTPTSLVFSYTVATGDNAASLGVTAVDLNGGSITDLAGNPLGANGGTTLPAYSGPDVDALTPTILSVTATPATGPLDIGTVGTITFTPNEPLFFVGGTPSVSLNDGGTATYTPTGSTSTAMNFVYTVAAGQDTPSLEITGFSLNGTTIEDSAGNTLTPAATAAVPALNGPQIDTTPPVITSITANPATGTLGAGKTVTVTVAVSKSGTITGGTPSLTMSDGGTAVLSSATSGTMVFTYTVPAGDSAADLAVQAFNLNGGTLTSAAGATTTAAPTVPANTGPTIDATAPTVSGVVLTPSTGTFGLGATVTLTLSTSKAITIAGGVPTLTLNDGGTATYDAAASTPTSAVFTYTVGAGQDTAKLAFTALNLNGATVTDAESNALALPGTGTTPLPSAAGPAIDTGAPAAPTLALDPAATTPSVIGTTEPGATVAILVNGTQVGTTTADSNGNYNYTLPASVPAGLDTVTATSTDSLGNTSSLSIPLQVAVGSVLDWINPTAGAFPTSGLWQIAGVQTTATPNASNTAEFVTGSATPYSVSGNGTVGRLNVTDQVTTTGQLAAVGLTDATTGLVTDLAITAGGQLTLAGGSFSAAGAVTLGGGSNGTLAVTAQGAFSAAGGVDLLAGGTLEADSSAAVAGAVTIGGGSLLAVPLTGSSAIATLDNPVTLMPGATDVADGTNGATLDLGGVVSGSGTLTVTGKLVLADAADSYSGGTILDNGNLDVAAAGAEGTGAITSLAGTTNTINDEASSGQILSNGADTILLGSGSASVTTTGGANITGGSGNATLVGLGGADTVTGGSGTLAVSGSADLVESTSTGGNVTYTGTGQVIYTGTGTGSETISAAAGSTITTGTGNNLVMLGGGKNYVKSAGNDTIQSGSGAATILASGAMTYVTGGSGSLFFAASAGAATVTGGTGVATLFGGTGGGQLTGGSAGHNILVAGGGNTTLIGGGSANLFYGSAAGTDLITAAGTASTLVGGGGIATLTGGGSGLLFGGAGSNILIAGSADSLVGGSGSTTLMLDGNNVAFGAGGTNVIDAARGGSDSMVGGNGTTSMVLQGNDVAFGGPGTSMIQAGSAGSDSIVGGGGLAHITLEGSDLVFTESGSTTINGSAAGNDSIVGGIGNTVLFDAAGSEIFYAGVGASTVNSGAGSDTVLAGSGTLLFNGGSGFDQLVFGTGAATAVAGTGRDVYEVDNGGAGGSDVISGFKVGTDQIGLFGYGPDAIASQSVSSAGTALTLSDGTSIMLLGIQTLASDSIVH